LFYYAGFLSLSSSKLIAVQPGNALSSGSAEYPMLMAKSNQDTSLHEEDDDGDSTHHHHDESQPIVTDR